MILTDTVFISSVRLLLECEATLLILRMSSPHRKYDVELNKHANRASPTERTRADGPRYRAADSLLPPRYFRS